MLMRHTNLLQLVAIDASVGVLVYKVMQLWHIVTKLAMVQLLCLNPMLI